MNNNHEQIHNDGNMFKMKRYAIATLMLTSLVYYFLSSDDVRCMYQVSKWRYSMWFLIISQIFNTRRMDRISHQVFVSELAIGPFCIYPIIFLYTLLGVYFYLGVVSQTPECIDLYTYYSVRIMILTGFLLSSFFWMTMAFYLIVR